MYTNIDSFNNKRQELLARVSQIKPDIIGVTEVNPKNAKWDLTMEDINLEGYTAYVNLRGRGVVLYVKQTLHSSEMDNNKEECDSVWCKVKLLNDDNLIVGVVYRSPNLNENQNNQLITSISKIVESKPSHLMIIGDFNHPGINWIDQTSEGSLQERCFIESFRDWFMWQHCNQPTRYRSEQQANILDLVMTNEENMVDNIMYNEPIGKSDHSCLNWVFKCYAQERMTKVVKYSFDRADFDEMRVDLGSNDWDGILQSKSVNEQWKTISEKITKAMNTYVPHRSFTNNENRRRQPPWMNNRVMAKIKRKHSTFERYKLTKEGKEYVEYVKSRNSAKTEIRKAVKEYEQEIAKIAKKNPKAFYRHVNNKLKTRPGIGDLQMDDGSEVVDAQLKANVFNQYFSSVYTVEDLNSVPLYEAREGDKISSVEVTEEEVIKLLKNLQPDKSPGPDSIHPRILKECATQIAGPLTTLFHTSLREGKIPEAWKEANVSPIFKKGSRIKADNYRPISLTSVCCKLLERFVRNSLLKHMLDNKYMSDKQHGFVSGRSCTTQMLKVVDKITEMLDLGGSVDMIYLDFAKAFDTVPHRRLIKKLESYGVNGSLLDWIRDFLEGRKQRVVVDGMFSEWAGVLSGVPQGSVLGPILFVCYINDLPQEITSFLYMYADDTKMFRESSEEVDREALQKDLDKLSEWTSEWQLKFNVEKCKVMYFGGSRNKKGEYCMSQLENNKVITLQETTLEKDLGIWLTNDLKSHDHVVNAVKKANQILGLIRRTFSYFDCQLVKQLFVSLVRPHLEYGNVVWNPYLRKDIDMIERVQHRATRLVPGFAKLPYEERLRRMDLTSLEDRRLRGDAIEVFKYMHKIYNVDESGMLPRHNQIGTITRGHSFKLLKRKCNSQVRANFFGLRVVNNWNRLPENVVASSSVNCFKGRYDRWLIAKDKDNDLCATIGPQA